MAVIFSHLKKNNNSAGVGRTGAYIAVAGMLSQLAAEGRLDLPGFLRHIRNQRSFLVQTVEQYVSVHEVLLVACEIGDTEISLPCLQPRLKQLLTHKDSLFKQWKFLNGPGKPSNDVTSALTDCNRHKNRDLEFLPTDDCRVPLTPRLVSHDRDQCDFVNASWTSGFYSSRELIITQHPMEKTIGDFWRLVWEQNCQTIVLFSAPDYQFYPCFWPEAPQDSLHIEGLKITLEEEHSLCGLPELHLKMRPERDAVASGAVQPDQPFSVTLLLAPGWPHAMAHPVALVNEVTVSHALRSRGSPILVVDKLGGVEAATFCTLATTLAQFAEEKRGNLFQAAALVQKSRPHCWRRQEDFNFIYRMAKGLEEFCTSRNGYVHAKRNSWSSISPLPPSALSAGIGTLPKFPSRGIVAPQASHYGTVSRVPTSQTYLPPSHDVYARFQKAGGGGSPSGIGQYSTLPTMTQMDMYQQRHRPDLLMAAGNYNQASPGNVITTYYNPGMVSHPRSVTSPTNVDWSSISVPPSVDKGYGSGSSNGSGVLRSLSEVSVVTVVENDGGHRAPPEGMETVLATLDCQRMKNNQTVNAL
ncbi:unnamed protein product [Notodromas monacha]|uniref:Tyrosine-protein phosphatase domain-containing protein n=1 Tax=Notodromas monacha TaxID=399045 RepID=A0A7R9BPJ6_9CRUS|nr:unnamed protein product [Notodromas monacha]CAG0917801.1 unnamed protein product [Notodromas monacha]